MGSTLPSDNPPLEVPWMTIKAWVDANAVKNTSITELSKSQLAALSCLFPFAQSEPELDDQDYVSQLMLLGQAQRRQLPVFKDLSPIEVPIDGASQLRWRCVCTIPWKSETIPMEGYGYDAGKTPPLFASKKRAKQFAAREALRYLTSSGTNDHQKQPNPVNNTSPTPRQTPATSPRAAVRTPSPPTSQRPLFHPPATQTPPPNVTRTPGSAQDESSSTYARVAAMAAALGTGIPTYRIEEDQTRPNFYNGRAVFFNGAPVPTDIGVVDGVLGKKQAKLQIAERVLKWMEAEKINRDAILGTVFSPRRQ